MNQQLFDYFYSEHGIKLLATDMQEIERIVLSNQTKTEPPVYKRSCSKCHESHTIDGDGYCLACGSLEVK